MSRSLHLLISDFHEYKKKEIQDAVYGHSYTDALSLLTYFFPADVLVGYKESCTSC